MSFARQPISAFLALTLGTLRETTRTAGFLGLLGLSGAWIVLSPNFAIFAFDTHDAAVREMGIATIRFFGLLFTIGPACGLLGRDFQQGTAGTLLAAPISRSVYFLSRIAGLLLGYIVAVLALGAILSGVLFKLDGGLVLALFYAILEIGLLLTLASGLSTRLSPGTVAVGVSGVFVAGHLLTAIQGALQASMVGRFVSWCLVALIPNLQALSLEVWQPTGPSDPNSNQFGLLGMAALAGLSFIVVYLVLGILSLSRKDIA